jgi:hypothetical protein
MKISQCKVNLSIFKMTMKELAVYYKNCYCFEMKIFLLSASYLWRTMLSWSYEMLHDQQLTVFIKWLPKVERGRFLLFPEDKDPDTQSIWWLLCWPSNMEFRLTSKAHRPMWLLNYIWDHIFWGETIWWVINLRAPVHWCALVLIKRSCSPNQIPPCAAEQNSLDLNKTIN